MRSYTINSSYGEEGMNYCLIYQCCDKVLILSTNNIPVHEHQF
jgi:hypothetical protein